jgi:fluoroquinolone transport system permease protein
MFSSKPPAKSWYNLEFVKMNRFISLLKLDLLLITRNRILHIAALITAFYAGILQVLPENNFIAVMITLIFTDPVTLGFMFIGVMVLFEKGGNTLQALSVTPVRSGEYLWSKAITLTLVALVASMLMALAGVGLRFNPGFLIAAVVFSSLLFVFIGFVGVSKIKTFNQYFIIIPLFMIPGFLPFLNFFNITHTWLWYLLPTQASLILFSASFHTTENIPGIQILYALLYLPLSCWLAFHWAKSAWGKAINS